MTGNATYILHRAGESFSPLLIGSCLDGAVGAVAGVSGAPVSVPYSSGVALTGTVSGGPRPRRNVSVPYSSGVALTGRTWEYRATGTIVSVPYSSGVALTGAIRLPARGGPPSFSPLLIGSCLDGATSPRGALLARAVSVPYSSGVALTARQALIPDDVSEFQSPTHRELP